MTPQSPLFKGSRKGDVAEAEAILAELRRRIEPPPPHSCGRCRTPYGVSAIRCVNDPGGD